MDLFAQIRQYCYSSLPAEQAVVIYQYITQQCQLEHREAVVQYLSQPVYENAGVTLSMLFNYKLFNRAPKVTPVQLAAINNIIVQRFNTQIEPQLLQHLCITVGSLLNQLPYSEVTQLVSTAQPDDIITNNPLMKPYLWTAERMDDAQRGKQLTRQSIYTCPNPYCGSNDVAWNEAQTKSADEPATIFISCRACGQNNAIQG